MISACAYIWAYNEEDFISWTILNLLNNGIDVHIFDNWSTDRTFEIASSFNNPSVKVERFPDHQEECTSLTVRLKALEEIARHSKYEWIINHDVDEIRTTGSSESIRQFIDRMDRRGYTAINHRLMVYSPREGWTGEQNPETFFTNQIKTSHVDNINPHIKCWKRGSQKVELVSSGGHEAKFADRIIPHQKLILKHYPLRTQAHARRKLEERKRSYAEQELEQGWHVQYNTKWW